MDRYSMTSTGESKLRIAARVLLALNFVGVGIAHFVVPHYFVAIMPPYLPWHYELVILSGVCEVVLGLLLFIERIRSQTRWGLIALLVAVFPANVQHAMDPPPEYDPGIFGWVRLPLQLVLIAWVWWVTKPAERAS